MGTRSRPCAATKHGKRDRRRRCSANDCRAGRIGPAPGHRRPSPAGIARTHLDARYFGFAFWAQSCGTRPRCRCDPNRRHCGAPGTRQNSNPMEGLRERASGKRTIVPIDLGAGCSDAGAIKNARSANQPGPQSPHPAAEAIPLGASLIGAAEGANIVIDGLANGSTVTVGQSLGANTWRIPVSDLNDALVRPPEGYAGSMDLMVELRLTDHDLVDRKALHVEWTAEINAGAQPPADLKQMFNQFVENYTASTGHKTFSAREREILFTKFQQSLNSQISVRSAR